MPWRYRRLSMRQAGEHVNHKRVDRLYAEARLQVKRRRRKKVPVANRQPLVRPEAPNAVWSADFVFDRTAVGRVLKCLEGRAAARMGNASCGSSGRGSTQEGDHGSTRAPTTRFTTTCAGGMV